MIPYVWIFPLKIFDTTNDVLADPRFTNIQTDPKFRLPSKKNTHVQIDKRFAHMLRDEGFSRRAKVDRYGRKLPKDAGKKELERYYRIEDEGSNEEADEDDEVEAELRRANAECEVVSSSSSDESAEEVADEEVFGMLEEGEGDIPMGEVTSRIAVVNLDWDNVRAADLMAVFSSFTPGDGRILKISVYPSEFGKERMEREEMEGPPKEIFAQSKPNRQEDDTSSSSGDDEEEDLDDDEMIKRSLLKEDAGQEFNSAKLRRYQLERLRYFYAVLTCSSKEVAQAIYEAVDGTEYLTTANFFDLRFIPDDTEFSDDTPRDECKRIPDGYKPNDFVTDALQHSKVRLTWDADDVTRKEAQKKAFSGSRADIDENDLKAYLGSDSSGDEALEPVIVDSTTTTGPATDQPATATAKPDSKLSKKDAERHRMRALLGLKEQPTTKRKSKEDKTAPVGDMQITFSSGLTSDLIKGSVFENEPERDETTVEKYVRKEKERKNRRKEKLKAARNPGGADVVEEPPKVDVAPIAQELDHQKDLGFNDPFFTAPSTTITTKKPKSTKHPKLTLDPEKRAELEHLIQPDPASSSSVAANIKHFDLTTLSKASKAALKAKKKRKLSGREKEALAEAQTDEFKMDVQDPRFKDVFERSEFAIDPSHPRFMGTGGMRELLEEGRKRRRGDGAEGDGDGGMDRGDGGRMGKRRKAENDFEGRGRGGDGEDVQKLVERVKGKVKRI